MFGFGKKRRLRRFEDWIIMGCGFIAENSRIYDNIIEREIPQKEKFSIFEDPGYIAGKFLFRTFGANAAIVGAGLQNKLDEEFFSQLQEILKLACFQGNRALPASEVFEKMNQHPGFIIEEIDIPELLKGGIGAEFMDKTRISFVQFCGGKKVYSEELVKLYIQALNYTLKDQDTESNFNYAMGMFENLRNAIMKKI